MRVILSRDAHKFENFAKTVHEIRMVWVEMFSVMLAGCIQGCIQIFVAPKLRCIVPQTDRTSSAISFQPGKYIIYTIIKTTRLSVMVGAAGWAWSTHA